MTDIQEMLNVCVLCLNNHIYEVLKQLNLTTKIQFLSVFCLNVFKNETSYSYSIEYNFYGSNFYFFK